MEVARADAHEPDSRFGKFTPYRNLKSRRAIEPTGGFER
jgi:hypothetical protein